MKFGTRRRVRERIAGLGVVPVVMALLVLTAGVAPVAGAVTADEASTETMTDSPARTGAAVSGTAISGCQQAPIDQSGVYNLTADVTGSTQQYCLNVTADDVVLDGMGHTLQGVGMGNDTIATTPVGVYVTGRNVTIRNVTIDHWQTGVAYRNASSHIYDSQITDIDLDGVMARNSTVELVNTLVTADDDGLQASNSELTVFTSRITDANDTDLQRGVRVNDHTHLVVTTSTIEDAAITGVFVNTFSSAYLWNNTIADSEVGVELDSESSSGHFTDNVIRGSDSHGVRLVDSNVTLFSDNTIRDVGGHGLLLESSVANVSFTDFVNVSQSAVVLDASSPAAQTDIHSTDLRNVSEYGVDNRNASAVVNATNNRWGAQSGPSSNSSDSDAPFADPSSGALADGGGAMVSEGSTPGVSNVRFDPLRVGSLTTTTTSPTATTTANSTVTTTATTTGAAPTATATTGTETTGTATTAMGSANTTTDALDATTGTAAKRSGEDAETTDGGEASTPGFTPATAVVAVLTFAVLAVRNRQS